MIVVRLRGGLGNQLFQYAAARALAHRLGVPLGLDTRAYRKNKLRSFELSAYRIAAVPSSAGSLPPKPRHRLRRRLWQALHPAMKIFTERRFSFDPSVLTLRDDTYLEGFFQSERYFRDAETQLRADLTLREPPIGDEQRILAHVRGTAAVSLHVRRGDYVSDAATRDAVGSLALSYYEQAVALIAERMNATPTVFIFSDDPEWARANLALPYPTEVIAIEPRRPPAHDLALMAACRHHVIANSSFSWWGAWLNPSQSKIVVAPQQWFANSALDTTTLLPQSWLHL